MKVLLLTTHLNIGGVTAYTLNLARALVKNGVRVWVASSGGELIRDLETINVPHIGLPIKTKFEFNPKLIFSLIKLIAFVRQNNIDLIHAQTRVTQVLAYFVSKINGTPYISTCHGFFKKSKIGRRLLGAWGDYVIAISDAVSDHLVKDFNLTKDRVALIYNGVDTEKFFVKRGEDEKGILKSSIGFEKSPVIGSISRLSPVKGLQYLIFAMKDILRDMPEARLLLVGEGPSKKYLMDLVENMGIKNSVFFALSTTETERFLSIIDVFIFCSLEEGLGLSLLEALASGKPCVASNVGGVSSIIENNKTGILVPPKDSHALREAIVKILKDKELSRTLSLEGRELVSKKFTLEKMTEGVLGVYEKAVNK